MGLNPLQALLDQDVAAGPWLVGGGARRTEEDCG
jgi:hypothetical protein